MGLLKSGHQRITGPTTELLGSKLSGLTYIIAGVLHGPEIWGNRRWLRKHGVYVSIEWLSARSGSEGLPSHPLLLDRDDQMQDSRIHGAAPG